MSTKIADPMAMRDRVKKPRGPKSLFTICVWTILLSSSLSAASSSPAPSLGLHPKEQRVSTAGGVTFICQAQIETGLVSLQWLVNETLLESLNLSNVTAEIVNRSRYGFGTLMFVDIPLAYNSTRITCVATFNSSMLQDKTVLTEDSLLIVQDIPSVRYLNISAINDTFSITWISEGDITGYCVNIINSASSVTLHSQCGITVTEFCYTLLSDVGCYELIVNVTPGNSAGNGSSVATSYSPEGPKFEGEIVIENEYTRLRYILTMSAPVCNASAVLADVYAETDDIVFEPGNGLVTMGSIISFTNEGLSPNRCYSVTITASNIAGSNTSYAKISTHDVVMVMIRNTQEMRLTLTATYSDHSTASGALFSFVFITDSGDVDFSRSFLLALDRNTSHNHTLPFDLYPGHCRVYVYDIEHDAKLSDGVGYPAVTEELPANLSNVALFRDNCTFSCTSASSAGLILAQCSHPNSSFAAGFQVIVQSTNASEVHKLYVNQSMDLHTPVTVPVERDGEYQVSIFAIREEMGILGPTGQFYSNFVMVSATDVPSVATTAQGDVSTSARPQSESSTRGIPSEPSENSSSIPFIAVGVVVAVLVTTILVVLVILLGVCCIQRRHKQQSPTLVELNMYCTTEELQEENEVAAAFTTLSPADISAGYSVVTASAGDGPPLYADVVAFSVPQPRESMNVGDDEQELLEEETVEPTAATYSSLSHSLKPKSCENGSGHYSLLNHPTKSKPAKASGFIRPDTSLYSSLGELSQTKKLLTINEDSPSKESRSPGTGGTTEAYSLLNLSARDHPKTSSAGDTEENLDPCYATVGGSVGKKQEKQVAATKENKGKDGSGVTTGQQDEHVYATVNLAAKKNRRLKQQSAVTAENSSTAEPDVEDSSGRGDSDMGLYDDARPNNQRSEGPSKENPDHESNSEDQQHQYSKVDLTKKKKRKVCHQGALSESQIANGDGPTIGEQGITGSDITSGAVTSCDVTSCDVTNFDIISEVEAGACCPQQPRALPQPPTVEEDHQIENNGVDNASPGEPDIVTTAAATENVRREAAKYCDVDLLEASTFSGPLNGSKVQYSTITGTRNKHDIPYEFVATSPPSVISPAGVLGDFNRVVYSDLRTDSSDTTARTTSHNAAHASPSHQDHVAEGGGSSGEKEGKPKYCEVTLLEDSTVKDVPILNGHGVEYSTVTGTQNKHSIHYAFVDPVPSSTEAPAPFGDTNKVVYSAVRPHVGSLGKSEERCNNDTTSATDAHSATNAHSYSVVDLSKKRNKKPKPATDNKSTAQD